MFKCILFFLCTLQRREISLIFRESERHLATKFCTKPNKTEKTPRSIAVVLLLILWRITARELKMMEIFMVFDNTNVVVFVSV